MKSHPRGQFLAKLRLKSSKLRANDTLTRRVRLGWSLDRQFYRLDLVFIFEQMSKIN